MRMVQRIKAAAPADKRGSNDVDGVSAPVDGRPGFG
jgi:hypothetical protein